MMFPLAVLSFCVGLVTVMGCEELILNEASSNQYTTICKNYQYFFFNATNPCKDIIITVTSTAGTPNIYVSKTQHEPTMEMLTWAETDSNSLTISQWDPESSPGEYYGMDDDGADDDNNDGADDDNDELTYEHHR